MKISFFLIIFMIFGNIVFVSRGAEPEELMELDRSINGSNIMKDGPLIKNQPDERFADNVELHVLDKITGRTSKITAKIGETIKFERLEIVPLKCWKSFPEENPENKLLLKIFEIDQHNRKKKEIFYGWIFSSAPSVSGLEHPLYDVELKDCTKTITNGN
ncbi:hypothetical protein FACS1894152_2150 [Bacilli bacterium]|nr:hypothetical protein FACS1894152_2150 [Bacilli bacterium]